MCDSSETRSVLRSHWPLATKVFGTNKIRFVRPQVVYASVVTQPVRGARKGCPTTTTAAAAEGTGV